MVKYWKWAVVFIAFLTFSAAIYYWIDARSLAAPVVIILSGDEMQSIINNDADHYYEKFHEVDYKVRNVTNKEEYLEKISKSGCDGDIEVAEKVKNCIEKIHTKLLPQQHETINGVQIGKLLKLTWKIGFTCDKYYENGLPHTRGDTIILNNRDVSRRNIDEVCKLLIHEKTHIYQKNEDVSDYLDENYNVVKRKDYSDTTMPANPDTDDFVYRDKQSNEILGGKYKKKPKHFRDVKFTHNDHTLEHPFESMAYKMESLYE